MQNAIIILISAITSYISYRLFSMAAGSLSLLKFNTVAYVFYVQIFLLTFIGSVLVACGYADFHYLIKPLSPSVKIYAWLGVLYSMIAMPFAMNLLNIAFKVKARAMFLDYIQRPVDFRHGPVLSVLILSLFAFISLFVLAYTFSHANSIPLFTALTGDIETAAIERIQVRRNFGGIEHITNLLGYLMMPVFAYYAAVYAFVQKRLRYWIMFIIMLSLSSLLLLYDTQKAPIVLFLIGFMVLFVLLFNGISRKTLVVLAVSGISLLAAGYTLTTDKGAMQQIFDIESAFWSRILITEYGGYALSLELFPDVIQQPTWYIGLPSFIIEGLGLPNVESARLLMMHINPEGVRNGTANLVSSYYLGEAWANYSWFGLILAPFIVGVVVQSLHIFLLKNPKSPLILAFYSYMTVRWLLNSGFVNFLYLKIILYPLVLYFFFKLLIQSIPTRQLPVERT